MRDERPDLPVHDVGDARIRNLGASDLPVGELPVLDVSSSVDARAVSDTIEVGGAPRVNGMLVLGVAGIAAVAAIVLVANRSGNDLTASRTSPSMVDLFPWPTPPVPPTVEPALPASALVEGGLTCYETGLGHGATVSFGIRNRLSHPVTVKRVSFARQHEVGIAATSIGINRQAASTCPVARDLHPAGHYRLAPGPAWISVRLTSTPACGTELRSRWVISFSDRGRTHQVSFVADGITTNCPPRVHFRHGRYG